MDIETVKQITKNKISTLERTLDVATQAGDLEGVMRIQSEIEETKITLSQIESIGG